MVYDQGMCGAITYGHSHLNDVVIDAWTISLKII